MATKVAALNESIKRQEAKLKALKEKQAMEDLKNRAKLGDLVLSVARDGWKNFDTASFKANVEKLLLETPVEAK